MPSTSPRTTAPIESSSRLRARPTRPFSKRSISLTAALGRPDTRNAVADLEHPTDGGLLDRGGEALEVRFSAAVISSVLICRSAIFVYLSGVKLVGR